MTCFWDNIIASLTKDDYNFIGYKKMNNLIFVKFLINMNEETKNISWNHIPLTSKQIQENLDHIDNFDSNLIENGYLCSTCDPFLCLICHLFQINITHTFMKTTIYYTIPNPRKTLHFKSNFSHFDTY